MEKLPSLLTFLGVAYTKGFTIAAFQLSKAQIRNEMDNASNISSNS